MDYLTANHTAEQLAAFRAKSIKFANFAPDQLFTCDTCDLRWKCALVYEPYNTDGDCLLDK